MAGKSGPRAFRYERLRARGQYAVKTLQGEDLGFVGNLFEGEYRWTAWLDSRRLVGVYHTRRAAAEALRDVAQGTELPDWLTDRK